MLVEEQVRLNKLLQQHLADKGGFAKIDKVF